MLPDQFRPCTKDFCAVHIMLSNNRIWWPLKILDVFPHKGVWRFYSGKHGTYSLCEKHHKLMVKMFEEDMAHDVAVMEAIDREAIKNGGR